MKKVLPVVISVSLIAACIVLGFIKGIALDPIQRKTLNMFLGMISLKKVNVMYQEII